MSAKKKTPQQYHRERYHPEERDENSDEGSLDDNDDYSQLPEEGEVRNGTYKGFGHHGYYVFTDKSKAEDPTYMAALRKTLTDAGIVNLHSLAAFHKATGSQFAGVTKREHVRAYNKRPDVAAKRKAYYSRPDIKQKRDEYNKRPDVIAKKKKMAIIRRKIIAKLVSEHPEIVAKTRENVVKEIKL